MKTIIHRADERGHADLGWLSAYHSFSFASYYNPSKVQFGALRVLNDDTVSPSMGFGTHPHDNMEIITIPLEGAVKHKDSTGGEGVIAAGDVQIMSAGSGVYHSEFNASHQEFLNLLQIWIFPKEKNIKPRYEQLRFEQADRRNKIQTVVSPENKPGLLWINQDAWLSLSDVESNTTLEYELNKTGNGVYVFVIEGEVEVADNLLQKRDAIGISETIQFSIIANTASKLLFIEVPMELN